MVVGVVASEAGLRLRAEMLDVARRREKAGRWPAKKATTSATCQQTPDHRALILTTVVRRTFSGRVLRVDLATRDTQVVFDEPKLCSLPPVFHPSGKWMVLSVEDFSTMILAMMQSGLPESQLSQPHLQARDVATGALLEDVVSPPAIVNSAVFSPDGKTLATSGAGGVLLWDFSDPPGKAAPATVGQPFAAAGTLVDGTKLDWAAYRGRVVLVAYWATWCQPCVAEIPEIRHAYDALHPRGFDVLAVSLDVDQAVLGRFVAAQEVPWPVVAGATAGPSAPEHPLRASTASSRFPNSFCSIGKATSPPPAPAPPTC